MDDTYTYDTYSDEGSSSQSKRGKLVRLSISTKADIVLGVVLLVNITGLVGLYIYVCSQHSRWCRKRRWCGCCQESKQSSRNPFRKTTVHPAAERYETSPWSTRLHMYRELGQAWRHVDETLVVCVMNPFDNCYKSFTTYIVYDHIVNRLILIIYISVVNTIFYIIRTWLCTCIVFIGYTCL